MRNDAINMSRAQDKGKTEFPIGTEPTTFRSPVGCSMTCVLRTARISNVEIVMRVMSKAIQS